LPRLSTGVIGHIQPQQKLVLAQDMCSGPYLPLLARSGGGIWMIARARVLSNLQAIRVLLLAGRVDDALVLIDGFKARIDGAGEDPIEPPTRESLRVIVGGRGAS
jgi:hypothetical protein